MLKTEDRTLIQILAASDAIFRPMRKADWTAPAPSNLYEARQRFPSGGTEISTGSGDEAVRKAQQRIVADLAAKGLLTLSGDKRRSGVRLTEAAEAGIRSLCGLPGLDAAHAMLQKVVALSAKADNGMILSPEYFLLGWKNYRPGREGELWRLSVLLAPALLRGWLESKSDIHGRAYYFATDLGRAAAKQPAPTIRRELPSYSDDANNLYRKETLASRERLRSAKPTHPGEIGYCPLPVSIDIQRPRARKVKK